ncbi:MAG TPA: glycosyltransferase, partial [Candidatus Sumerlaeia bacterium]|nr:glycosyltransferase [Candidatus Sumerlaeia bacterium]
MKICYLLEVNNPHSQRWVRHFAGLGHEVLVLSDSAAQEEIAGVRVINPQMNLLTTIVAFK